jgi:hypothetical protein
MTIDDELAVAAGECDYRFEQAQSHLIAELRAQGVTDAEMPEVLAWAHGEYWRERCALLDQLRAALERVGHP